MKRAQIKICGLTTEEAVHAVVVEGCGYAGFIAHPPSPRHLLPEAMAALTTLLPASTRSVLVTANASDTMLAHYIDAASPALLQLHGEETPERCHAVRTHFGLPIIKAIGVTGAEDVACADVYTSVVDILLFDTKLPDGSSGGTGVPFDWGLLAEYRPNLPWFLSGGIGVHNVQAAVAQASPPLLDVSSALESTKGIKDIGKIRDFMQRVDTV
jgi:phosphoribosylanthranilate isomerase